ncbi:MAG: beta-ketoacyl-[acyl-carrier-protein] synthase family protein, partial [Nitrospirae bacterium]|nr:beta-ketoacyl-[acyl-carrier-protein] synthase family protein [Nitrospirota bacterium]
LAGYEKGVHRLNPYCVPRISPNAVSGQIAIRFNAQGPSMVISTACSSGNIAIGEAFRKIQYGEADICITGGVEAPLTQFTFGAYDAMRVLSKRNSAPIEASRPFDKDRDGFVLGEGGGMLFLEELHSALKRGAKIYAELGGYSLNSGSYNMVIPKPEADDIAKVMIDSIKDAQLEISDIDYINAHGTSTLQNDKAESKAITDVFKERAKEVNISSTKSMIGHTIAASGALETIICCLVIENNIIPPTINYHTPDPDCDLNYTPNTAVKKTVNNCITNSFGFGSSNCLIIKRFINN